MRRFWVLLEKELKHGPAVSKFLNLGFALGYGIGFGIMSRMSDLLFEYMLSFMPILLAAIGTSAVLMGISADKQARTGEMVLTTGISIREYIYSKVVDSIIQTIIGVLIFEILYVACAGKMFSGVVRFQHILFPVLASIVLSVFYACFALIIKVHKIYHKLIIAVFLLIVALLAVLAMLGSFFVISLVSGFKALAIWAGLLVYGVICLEMGVRFLKIRDFVSK